MGEIRTRILSNCSSFCPAMPPQLQTHLITIANVVCFTLLILFFSGIIQFPSSFISLSSFSLRPINDSSNSHGFTDLVGAFRRWDSEVGCNRFKEKHGNSSVASSGLQGIDNGECGRLKMKHVSVLVKGWHWVPDNLDNLYSCPCGLSCLWTKSPVLADNPDALLFETTKPPLKRENGEALRVYMDLEPERKRSGGEDIFISYHAEDDIQTTYAGAMFHNDRNYHIASFKNTAPLVYWSSSHCVSQRNKLAQSLLSKLSHRSFGKCLNNVGGTKNKALSLYPHCALKSKATPKWWDHLHCAMSHYKFVLAIENTRAQSYVTEKLFYALDSASVPIYFGAPNVEDFVPPHSIIDGTKFGSLEELALYVKALANDSLAYAEYHAWRRCGVLGNYGKTRALSLDTLPCRLCEAISKKGGRNADAKLG